MTKLQMEEIATRAAELAVCCTGGEITYGEGYAEYLDQLQNNDCQCLRTWIGWQIEEGVREAVEILKMMIRGTVKGGTSA